MAKIKIINGKGIIPVGTETIEYEMIMGDTTLVDIAIPDTVRFIGMQAFKGCISLRKIKLPQSVNYIDSSAFEGCTSLKRIDLPAGIKGIDRALFRNCSSLEEIVIPEGVKSISEWAFSGCSRLSWVSLPKSLESIEMEDETFNGCDLDDITIHPDNKYYSVKGKCLLSGGGTTLIRGCNGSVIPGTVKEIGPNAFSGCTRLEGIVIPGSVECIGCKAFEGCTSLKSIVIPKTVGSICEYAFSGCSSLADIVIDKESTEFNSSNSFRGCPNAKRDGLYDNVIDTLVTLIETAEKEINDTL